MHMKNHILKGGGDVKPAVFQAFSTPTESKNEPNLRSVLDVQITLTARLGSTDMKVQDILVLSLGSIIELDNEAGSPISLYANGKYVAKGEVLVSEGRYAIRIVEIANKSVSYVDKK